MNGPAPLEYNADEPQYPQQFDWTCSACSLAWLNRALGIQHATDELSAAEYIGTPENINAQYGLMDGSGRVLVDRLREQGAPAFNLWPTWDQAYQLALSWPLLIGGVTWNHWVGVRSAEAGLMELANSAEGWMNVWSTLTYNDWSTLGPFACVAVPLLRNFPPPQQTGA